MKLFELSRSTAAVAIAALFWGGAAQAQTYVEVTAGWTDQPDLMWNATDWEMDRGEHRGAAVGHYIRPNIAVELEALHTRTNYTGWPNNDLTATSVMVNGVYSFNRDGRIRPYAGLGLGVVRVGYSPSDSEDDVFGWQAMAGTEIPIANRVSGFIEYRYQDAATAGDGPLEWEYMSHNLGLGLRYTF
jgi:opacity protein-like surface antigen